MDPIAARCIELVAKAKNLPPGAVHVTSTFEELEIDSLDKINLSFEVEEAFGISIPDDGLRELRTVGDVVTGVERLLEAQRESAAT